MKLHLSFLLVLCFFQFGLYGQKEIDRYSKYSGDKMESPTPSLSTPNEGKMTKPIREIKEGELKWGPANGSQNVSNREPIKSAPVISGPQVPEAEFAQATKLPTITTANKVKTKAEEIAEIEREIDRIANSDKSDKALRLSKLEKLLEKKKLEKFSQDRSE